MTDGSLLRLIGMVQRELAAADVRVEIGGAEPSDSRLVWVALSSTRRIVVLFDSPPPDPAQARSRLQTLVEAFSGTASPADAEGSRPPGALTQALLNEQLGMLAERIEAARIVVIDDASPVIWGSSDPFQRSSGGVEEALRIDRIAASAAESGVDFAELLASGLDEASQVLREHELDRGITGSILREIDVLRADGVARDADAWRAVVLTARAIARIRYRPVLQAVHPRARRIVQEEGFGLLAKPFASSYWLVAVFDRIFSELRVEGTVVRVLPRIERLVLALPPVDPPPIKGRVVSLYSDK